MQEEELQHALEQLANKDAKLAESLEAYGRPAARSRDAGFRGLLRIILAQQVSVAAANAIEARLATRYPQLHPQDFVTATEEDLRACGLSRQKAGYAKGVGSAILSGALPIDDLSAMEDNEVITRITALKGLGLWSAEIYCMFCLGRADIFPADDLALQVALQKYHGKRQRPTATQVRKMAVKWKPYRTAAAIFMWHYYRGNPA